MKMAVRILSVLVLIALFSPVILLKGCGELLTGGQCGGCPDSVAPYGSSVAAPTISPVGSIPNGSSGCVDALTFTIIGPDNEPLNDVCVEIFTNGYIKESKTAGDCTISTGYVAGYLRTRTDAGGTATVDFSTGALSCGSATSNQSLSFFVQVSSCTAGETASATWTLVCP